MTLMTMQEACEYLRVARSTFDEWRARGQAPRVMKLPNGEIRIRREWIDAWVDERAQEAA